MKRVLLVLPFVLAACGSGVTEPSRNLVPTVASLSKSGGTCILDGTSMSRGFNQNGYNYCARIFDGAADGVDKVLDGKVWGDPTYAADHLIMKWNDAWDACNAAYKVGDSAVDIQAACAGAWTDNEWNGKVKGGSGAVWHSKIKWIGSCTEGATFPDGGYCLWNEYEVVMDQGLDPRIGAGHIWFAHAIPTGYEG